MPFQYPHEREALPKIAALGPAADPVPDAAALRRAHVYYEAGRAVARHLLELRNDTLRVLPDGSNRSMPKGVRPDGAETNLAAKQLDAWIMASLAGAIAQWVACGPMADDDVLTERRRASVVRMWPEVHPRVVDIWSTLAQADERFAQVISGVREPELQVILSAMDHLVHQDDFPLLELGPSATDKPTFDEFVAVDRLVTLWGRTYAMLLLPDHWAAVQFLAKLLPEYLELRPGPARTAILAAFERPRPRAIVTPKTTRLASGTRKVRAARAPRRLPPPPPLPRLPRDRD